MKIIYFILLIIAFNNDAYTQSHVYKYYGVEDGLPSSEVYSAFQDSKGYMWFATDAGVSRFNGYEFENFDASDGLTDNTVFLITEDHKGRIWFGTFNCQLSYYENGSIYPYRYNSQLAIDLKEKTNMYSFHIDSNETVFIGFLRGGLYEINKNGKGNFINSCEKNDQCFKIILVNNETIWGSLDGTELRKKYMKKEPFEYKFTWEILFMNGNVEKGNFSYRWRWGYTQTGNLTIANYNNQLLLFISNKILRLGKDSFIESDLIEVPLLNGKTLHSVYPDGNYLWICVRDKGVYKCRLEDNALVVLEHFFTNTSVARVFKDLEGGFWFQTLKEGVIYMPKEQIKHEEANHERIEVDTLMGDIYQLFDDGFITKEKIDTEKAIVDTIVYPKEIRFTNDLKYNYNDSSLLFEKFYYSKGRLNNYGNSVSNIMGKSYLVDSNIVYKVSDFGLSIMKNNEEIYYTYNEGHPKMWCTSVVKIDDKIWIGTKDGIRIFKNKKITNPFVNNKYLSTAITSMANLGENLIIIGTKSYGLLIVKNDSIISIINKEKGLTSNLIRTIHIDNKGLIWLGTNKGICRVSYKDINNYDIYNLTKKHGLISAEIKDIASYRNMIYAVTNKGLIQFDKTKIKKNRIPPPVYITGLKINEQERIIIEGNQFTYQENNISISYVGLNYRSLGEVEYQYRMLGIDTTWITTTTRNVRYPALPSGDYIFEVKAKNEDGVWSKPTILNFRITPPYWLTWWFITIIIILIIIAIGLIFKSREKKLIEKNEILKKNVETEKKMIELELKALRSQMNPHFIFNTLNSIQHYIGENNFKETNRYITKFSKLIRTVLNLSEKALITIREEVEMLCLYLDLEKMRFDEQFEYQIIVGEEIDEDYDKLPSMLIQPYIENAIWHGLMNKKQKGKIKIDIDIEGELLICTITDNGIGRQKAEEIKKKRKLKQKSVGMSITKERLDLINDETTEGVNVEIIDLYEEATAQNALKVAKGTKVVIKIPL